MEYRQVGRQGAGGANTLGQVQVLLGLRLRLVVVVRLVTGGLWLGWDCYPARLSRRAVFLVLLVMTFFLGECF